MLEKEKCLYRKKFSMLGKKFFNVAERKYRCAKKFFMPEKEKCLYRKEFSMSGKKFFNLAERKCFYTKIKSKTTLFRQRIKPFATGQVMPQGILHQTQGTATTGFFTDFIAICFYGFCAYVHAVGCFGY